MNRVAVKALAPLLTPPHHHHPSSSNSKTNKVKRKMATVLQVAAAPTPHQVVPAAAAVRDLNSREKDKHRKRVDRLCDTDRQTD